MQPQDVPPEKVESHISFEEVPRLRAVFRRTRLATTHLVAKTSYGFRQTSADFFSEQGKERLAFSSKDDLNSHPIL